MTTEKKYYHGIDSIRFLAACWVFCMHAIYITNYYNGSEWYQFLQRTIIKTGVFGVYFFFVMSGFFIFNLLMNEKKQTNAIDIPKFYTKRAKRILPIYIVVLFLGFVAAPLFLRIFPSVQPFILSYLYIPFDRWYYYVFGMVDFDLSWHNYTIPVLSVLWSVCVEIKFYLLAPLLLKFLNKYVLLIVLIMVILLCAWFRIQHYNHPHYYHYHPLAFADMLAIGGILAWIVNYKSSWIDKFKGVAKPITIIPYLLAVLLIISRKWIYSQGEWAALIVSLEPILVSIIFSLMIAEQNYATHSAIKFEKFKFLQYLGVRTYGVYGFHLFFLFIVIGLFQLAGLHPKTGLNNWIYLTEIVLTFSLTIIAATWFYNKVERPIIENKFFGKKINPSSKPLPGSK
jgi:peptidoglycan/LPS O-acetylase OafA/YrhL